jgi:molecular chaperone GrpE
VIKDNRKIDASGKPKNGGGSGPAAAAPAAAGSSAAGSSGAGSSGAGSSADTAAEPTMGQPTKAGSAAGAKPAEGKNAAPATPATDDGFGADIPLALGAELEALRTELDERLKDLQRVSAEYANYRKRVERDRGLVAEQSVGSVILALLPILDDIDRAREHGDVTGPFAAVADQLGTALGKFGLIGFGEKGDSFDPTRHEAVAHETSADVTEPTCVSVMRRGYLLGERLLRAALVAVADPE